MNTCVLGGGRCFQWKGFRWIPLALTLASIQSRYVCSWFMGVSTFLLKIELAMTSWLALILGFLGQVGGAVVIDLTDRPRDHKVLALSALRFIV